MLPFFIRMLYYQYRRAQSGGMRHEQSGKKKHLIRAGRVGAHCACHVAPIRKPAYFSFSGCQPPAKRDLCVFVQRVVLLPMDPHRADAGTALSAGDFGADGAVDSSSLNQIFH